jgi:hypothetical protein
MNWFPQIGAGSVAQFPLRRRRKWRSISNRLESEQRILLPDRSAGQIDWDLSFRELSDDEAGKLSGLFAASQGQFGAFSFIDPMANLLGWSEDLLRPDWQAGLMTMSRGQQAWTIVNGSPGAQSLQQTRGLPGDYIACFSAFIRSEAAGQATLQRDATQSIASVTPVWKRFMLSGPGTSGAAQSTFSITLAAGQTIDVWGLQVEAQPYPSAYKATTVASGIYEDTYFGTDELRMTSTAPGLSACEIVLSSRT